MRIFLRYESEFFHNVVNGRDIVAWAAVDHNRPDGRTDELIGFVTARTVLAKESEVGFTLIEVSEWIQEVNSFRIEIFLLFKVKDLLVS